MSTQRIPLKSGFEYDCLTEARKFYKYVRKPGVVRKAKKQYRKRFRRMEKVLCKKENSASTVLNAEKLGTWAEPSITKDE